MSTTQTFYGVKIWDKTNTNTPYYTEVDVKHDINKEFKAIVQEPINSEYPTIIYPSKTNYWKGTITGNFADNQTDECNIDFDNLTFKLTFTDFLVNKYTKYIQLADNLIIPIAIVPSVNFNIETVVNDGATTSITFGWVQCGSIRATNDSSVQCTVCNQILVPNANYCHGCGTAIT